jgi:energy-converting hydrogenase Eha subunit E
MSDPVFRYWNVEHITMMIIGIALITVGYAKAKRAVEAKSKHKAIGIFYTLAVLIILVSIFSMKGRNPWY